MYHAGKIEVINCVWIPYTKIISIIIIPIIISLEGCAGSEIAPEFSMQRVKEEES